MRKTSIIIWTLAVASVAILFGLFSFQPFGLRPFVAAALEQKSAATAPALQTVDSQQAAFNDLESQLIQIYQSASPSVVNITNQGYTQFFGQMIPQGGTGSGFVYDQDGRIITNYHVVEGGGNISVTLADDEVFDATIVGVDPVNDLAVIQIDAGKSLPDPLPLGDSDSARVGQFVLAIGNPFGLERTLTTGVVSALGRVIDSPQDNRFIGEAIQTDAAINPGNSGGPLLNLNGDVIGVNSQIISPSGSNAGIGFSVSANTVKRVVPALIDQGYYAHPWLGAQLFELNQSSAQILRDAGMDLPVDRGLVIIDVVSDAPAAKSGLKASHTVRHNNMRLPLGGDVITAINGQSVNSFQDLTVYLETHTKAGDQVTVSVIRDGKEKQVDVTVGEQPRSS
ncbi:MAG: trypsin-like peptidase domain-containing protein [Caldilineales bacterium]|nr:trypsin-like peptidase domain-containing protein [Caldilineales bacterium]